MAISSPAIVSRGNAYRLNPRMIKRREGWNPRNVMAITKEQPDIIELAGEIKALGLLLPLRVKKLEDGTFELVDGERRLTAVELLMDAPDGAIYWETHGVEVVLADPKQDDRTSLLQALASNHGKALLPLEEANAFKRLKEDGMTNDELAAATGRSLMTINAGLALLESAAELQAAVSTGAVGASLGRKIAVAARGNKEQQITITRAAVAAKKAPTPAAKKAAGRAVVKLVEDATRAKAAAKGKELVVKPLDAETLNALGAKIAKQVEELLKDLGLDMAGLVAMVKGSNENAALYSLGALDALKKAAGLKVSLTV